MRWLSVDSVILTNPEGESINLLPITGRIDIFEGIDKSFLHGRITVVDALGVADDYKIFGQESLFNQDIESKKIKAHFLEIYRKNISHL